jgi:Tfp pilus assembly protein PilV
MTRPTARRDAREETGFTLVEVLVAVVIEAIIVGALGMAFIGIMKTTTSTNQSLSRSGDARIAAAYIISDARNSSGPEVSTTTTSCADASPPAAGGVLVVQFGWTTTAALTGASTSNVVDYLLTPSNAASPYKLMRRECRNGVLFSDTIVASNVASATVSCLPTATPQCSGTPTSITVTITETADSSGNQYVYSLSGTFRKLIGGGVVPSTPSNPQSVVLLGASGTCSGGTDTISITGAASMRVYGDAYINTANGASCNAMDLQNSGVWQAGGTNIYTGGTCVASGVSVCPTVTTFSPAVTDPYASLAAPSTSGLPAQTGCSGAQASQTASPGLYSSGFNLGGGNTCTLASGIYVVQGGFNVGNGAVLKTGSGGVLIYLMSGQFSINGGANVTFTAMTSGNYKGLVLWQAAADTQAILWSNGGALVFNGAIYAPKAQLQITGNAQTPIVTALVVQTISLSNSGGITVGSASSTPLSIATPATIGPWTVNKAFSATINAAGGDGNYIWSATGLPAGLTMNAGTGVISGTPTATGSSSVTVTLNDQLGDNAATKSYTLVINVAPSITTASLPQGEKTAAYNSTVVGSAGATPYSWSATGLPAGLSINSSTGAITGTPNGTAGTATVNVTLVDNSGSTVSKSLSLVVINGPAITATTFANGTNGTAYSKTFAGTGGTTAYSWSATGLPAGLSMAAGTGVISGTPTASGNYTVAITLTDAVGGTATTSLSLAIQPKITSVTLTNKASGGTAGKMEVGDKITIVYSDVMSVGSFCSTWSGNASNQSLTGNGLLVNVSDGTGATNDALTISTSSGCTFNFGSINLGSNAYVTTAASFGGASGNTTIAWTASTDTLVITLGAQTGTSATVSASTSPIYTASGSLVDSTNLALGNSPFTVSPAAKRF